MPISPYIQNMFEGELDMAKKISNKKETSSKKNKKEKIVTPSLPQNIIPVGDRVEENKNIYLHQKVYTKIHKFAANKTENEHGGILVGRVVNELGKENTIIEGFIEAKYDSATQTTLTFTHETWDHFHHELEKRFKGMKIVGWIHTHPDFGIFLSENDKFIQENFFSDANQVAYVVDPIQFQEGFFYWIDGKIERCPGFYLFDKNGVKIKNKIWNEENFAPVMSSDAEAKSGSVWSYVTIALLAVALLINLFVTFDLKEKVDRMDVELETTRQELINTQNELANLMMYGGYYGGYGLEDMFGVIPETETVPEDSLPEETDPAEGESAPAEGENQ